METSCFLCHENYLNYEILKAHAEDEHLVKHDVDLVILLQLMTETEKVVLKKQLEERVSRSRNIKKEKDDSEYPEAKDMHENVAAAVNNEEPEINDVARCITPDVATKIMFWKGIERSPKHSVKELNGINFFSKDEASVEKNVNELLKRTLNEHLNGNKSADDTIDIFDEIFATNCEDLNESVDGRFRLLLEEDPCEAIVSGNCLSTSNSSAESEPDLNKKLPVVPRTKQIRKEPSSKKPMIIADGKYACKDCGKSFKFLTYLKGHINSKVGCKTRKQVPMYIR